MIFRRKKKEQTLAQVAARFRYTTSTRKLSKKDLEVTIDGYKFYYEEIPLNKKGTVKYGRTP